MRSLASTLRRVLAAHGLVLAEPRFHETRRRGCCGPTGSSGSLSNKIWCWDVTHFEYPRAKRAAFAIVDVVSRRWIDTLVSIERDLHPGPSQTSTERWRTEGLAELITPERVEQFAKDPTRPILLACSDNGPQMTSTATRDLFAALAVAQRHRRPRTPTDLAWIESLFGGAPSHKPRTPTSKRSATRPRWRRRTSNAARRRLQPNPACTPASATSPPTTSTPAEANTIRASGAPRAYGEPAATAPRLPSPQRHNNNPQATDMSWFISKPTSAVFSRHRSPVAARSPRSPRSGKHRRS